MAKNRAVFVFGMLYSILFTLDIFVMFSQNVLFQNVNAYTLLKNLPFEAYPAALFWAIPGGLLFYSLVIAGLHKATDLFEEVAGMLFGMLITPLLSDSSGIEFYMIVAFNVALFGFAGHLLSRLSLLGRRNQSGVKERISEGLWKISCSRGMSHGLYTLNLQHDNVMSGNFWFELIPFFKQRAPVSGKWFYDESSNHLTLTMLPGGIGTPFTLKIQLRNDKHNNLCGRDINGSRYLFSRGY